MGVRLEKVILELDDSGFSTKLVKDAAATALLTKELDKLGKTGSTLNRRFDGMSTRIDKNTDSLGAMNTELGRSSSGLGALADVHLAKTSRAADRADSSINQLTGRLRVMGEVGAIVGPGLIPIGALAVPAVTGLASSFGFAAAGALSLVVASQGVGDALKALNEASLEPTAANLDKAREAMAKIGPEAQAFVARFQEIRPALKDIRDDAAAGWFPGLTDALDDVERVAPRVGALLETIGETGGRLVAEGAAGLAGPEGRQFLKFLKTEAPQALSDFGHTIGNTIAGLGELWMAFTPLNRDFSSWMVEASQSFQDWADGLSETEGFREFVDYVRTNGPKVAEFAAAAADAFLEIVEAAAPLGGPVLESLTAILKVVAAIADSDLGTPIFAGVAALALLNRTLAVTKKLQGSALAGTAIGTGVSGRIGAQVAAVRGLGTSLDTTGRSAQRASMSVTAFAAAEKQRAAATRSGLTSLAKGGALAAGLAVASTGAADGLGLTNTASLALVGSLGGGLGIAIGATAGLMADLSAASRESAETIRSWNEAYADTSSISGRMDLLKQADRDNAARLADQKKGLDGFLRGALSFMGSDEGFTNQDAQTKALAELEAQMRNTEGTAAALGKSLGMTIGPLDGSARSVAELTAAYNAAIPAMQKLGITQAELEKARAAQVASRKMASLPLGSLTLGDENASMFGRLKSQIRDTTVEMDSAKGRTDAFADAVSNLGVEGLGTAASADALGSALSALLSPTLNAEAATDAWRVSLRQMRQELEASAGFASGSEDAIANREITRSNVEASMARLTALAGLQTTTEKDMAKAVAQTREEFIKSGIAAGFSREQISKRATALGLTPKLVKTIFDAVGINEVELKARDLRGVYDKMPKGVKTEIKANGIPKTVADVNRLVARYGLTEKQRTALITLKDLASKDISAVLKALGVVNNKKTNPTITAETSAAQAAINNIKAALASVQSKTVTVTTRSIRVAEQRADGGLIVGPGGPRDDVIPALLSNGEYVVKASAVDRYGVGLMDQINAKRFADGGFTGDDFRSPLGDTRGIGAPISTTVRTLSEVKQIMADIRDLKKLLDKDGKDELSKQRKKVVALELKAAEKRLKVAEKEEELQDKVRDKLRETRSNLQGVGSGFSLDSLAPDNRTKTVVQGAQATIGQLRRDVMGAGGVWSKDLTRWSKGLLAASSELDDVNAALARETTKRDALASTISDQQQALDQLTSTMKAFGDSVAGNFITNPFSARQPGSGAGSPELVAAQEQLKVIRDSATGDSVEAAARASELIAQIAKLGAGSTEGLTGLAKLQATLLDDTAAAEQMTAALNKLTSLGLDTTGSQGGLYKSLAESGDLQTAQELAALTAGQVDEYEKLFAARENAAAVLAAQTTQAVYGQQFAAQQASLAMNQAALVQVDANITKLNATAEAWGVAIRAMAPDVAKALRPQIDNLDKSIKDVGRDTAERLRRMRAVR